MTQTCRQLATAQAEPLAGTAPTSARRWLLIEYRGPWGSHVVRDQVGPELVRRLQDHGIGVLCVRTFDDRAPGESGRMWLTSAARASMHQWQFTSTAERDLHLAGIAATGDLPVTIAADAQLSHEPLLLVCTNGKRDTCCAEMGRAILSELSVNGTAAIESSHIGGHRFAGVTLLLPWGYVHQAHDATAAATIFDAARNGRLAMNGLRGRTGLTPPAQVAELSVRQRHEVLELDVEFYINVIDAPSTQQTAEHSLDLASAASGTDEDSSAGSVRCLRIRVGSVDEVVQLEQVGGPMRPESCGGEPRPLQWWRVYS